MVFKGHPVILDRVFRPLARIAFTAAGVIGSAVLAVFGLWWWMPVPFVVSLFAFEIVFWLRGDRPMTLTLDGSRLSLVDKVGSQNLDIDLAEVHCATVLRRVASDGTHLGVKLSSKEGPLLVLHLMTSTTPKMPTKLVDLDALGAELGPILGVVGGLSAREARVRQVFRGEQLLEALVERIDPAAWSRLGIRLWKGHEPDLDLVGYHQGPASAWLVIDPDQALLTTEGTTRSVAGKPVRVTSRTRTARLGWDVDEDAQEETLTMMRIEWADLVVCFRTEPDKVIKLPKRPGTKADYHTETIEGSCLWSTFNLANIATKP